MGDEPLKNMNLCVIMEKENPSHHGLFYTSEEIMSREDVLREDTSRDHELSPIEIFLYTLIKEFEKTEKSWLLENGFEEQEITKALEKLITFDLVVSFEE